MPGVQWYSEEILWRNRSGPHRHPSWLEQVQRGPSCGHWWMVRGCWEGSTGPRRLTGDHYFQHPGRDCEGQNKPISREGGWRRGGISHLQEENWSKEGSLTRADENRAWRKNTRRHSEICYQQDGSSVGRSRADRGHGNICCTDYTGVCWLPDSHRPSRDRVLGIPDASANSISHSAVRHANNDVEADSPHVPPDVSGTLSTAQPYSSSGCQSEHGKDRSRCSEKGASPRWHGKRETG